MKHKKVIPGESYRLPQELLVIEPMAVNTMMGIARLKVEGMPQPKWFAFNFWLLIGGIASARNIPRAINHGYGAIG